MGCGLGHLLGERDVVQHAEVERLGALARLREEAHGLVVLPVVEEEVGAPLQQRGVGTRGQ